MKNINKMHPLALAGGIFPLAKANQPLKFAAWIN